MTEDMITIFILLIAFQVKHFAVDFFIQMHRKDSMKKFDSIGWKYPLFKHATDHGIFTAIIAALTFMYYDVPFPLAWWALGLLIIDSIAHFVIDRIKASPNMLGKYCKDMTQKSFWACLGFDQMMHHLTHYVIIAIIVLIVF